MVEVGVVGRKNNLGFTIIGHSGIELLPDVLGAFLLGHAGQDGTRLFRDGCTSQDSLHRDVEVDRFAMLVNPLNVVEKAGRASASGDDGVVDIGSGVELLLFQLAEGLFAIAFEEDGNGGVEDAFERLVEVEPLVA